MLSFIKRIRRSQLGFNQFRNYMIYAIGEIFLIVIGILLALQINNWNTNRLNRMHEKVILGQLLDEYRANLDQILQKVLIRNNMISSCQQILSYIGNPSLELDPDSLEYHLSRAIIAPTTDPAIEVTEELINSGKLYLIQNPELRTSLTKWSGHFGELSEEENQLVRFTNEEFYTFLIEVYQTRNILIQLESDELAQIYKLSRAGIEIEMESRNGNARELLNESNLDDHISTILWYCHHTNDQATGLIGKTKELISLLKLELPAE